VALGLDEGYEAVGVDPFDGVLLIRKMPTMHQDAREW